MRSVDADLLADSNAVLIEIHARGRGQHDARTIVVREYHVALDRAVGEDDALGAQLPQTLARQVAARVCDMVGDAFGKADEVVVVVAESGGAGENLHIVHRLQAGNRFLRPLIAVETVDLDATVEAQRTAGFGLLVTENDLGTGMSRSKGSRKTGNAGTHHQHVAMRVAAGIVIRIRFLRGDAETGGTADDRLVDMLPCRLRPHEGLVVEAGREEGRHQVVDAADIEGQRREAVLRFDDHAVEDFLHRGTHVRLLAGAVARNVDQRVRLFGTGRENAARAVILERAADQMDVVGDQRRGDSITLQRRVALAVEGEARGSGRRQATLACNTVRAAHCASPSSAS